MKNIFKIIIIKTIVCHRENIIEVVKAASKMLPSTHKIL